MRLLIISLLTLFSTHAVAAEHDMTEITTGGLHEMDLMADDDSITIMPDSLSHMHQRIDKYERRIQRYEERLERRQRMWNAVIPSTLRLQMFGSTGLINIGGGWRYGKRHQWETDFMFGYVPQYEKDKPLVTFTLRQTYVPWTKHLYGHRPVDSTNFTKSYYSFQPLAFGVYANTVLDGDYWANEPAKYPERDYYRFSTKVRFHVFVGQRYTLHIPTQYRYLAESASLFWELSTCDLYLVTKFVNKNIPFKDMLSLSFGLKMDI